MNQVINDCIGGLNGVGRVFCDYAAGVFVQSAILVVVLLIADLFMRKRVRAVFRYCVWLLVLVKLILPPTLALPTGIGYWLGDRLPAAIPASDHGVRATGLLPANRHSFSGSSLSREAPQIRPPGMEVGTAGPMGSVVSDMTPMTWQGIFFLLWLVGVLVFAALLAQRVRFVRGLMAFSSPAEMRFQQMMDECAGQVGIRKGISLRVSGTMSSPAICGLLRPIVLVPAKILAALSPEGLRAVLIHELAHMKRGDLWINSLQTLLQVVHFYNPLVWVANLMIRRTREEAVDEAVLVALGGRAKDYSNTLIDIGEMALWKADLGLRLIGVAESEKILRWRIKHMLTRPIPKTAKLGVMGTVVLVVMAAVLLPMACAHRSGPGGRQTTQPGETTGLAASRNAPVAPQVTGVSATETASLGGGLVARRVLTDASGVGGVLTADGKYISSNIDRSTGDVVQFEVASGQRTRITNRGPWTETDKSYENQAFSRDGKQIAYNVESSDPNTKAWVYQVRIRNLDGSGLRTLYSEKGSYAVALDWSPDAGSVLALRDRNKATELTLISAADGSVGVLRNITSGWFSFQRASFSPDGRFVAFSLVREGSPPNGDVLLMTADGRNEVVVAGHPAEDRLLRWTPDGRSLVFLSDRSGTWDIWTVHITEGKQQGEPELLKKDFGYDSEVLGFAPDGSLYYTTQTYSGCLYHGEVDLETGKILVPPAPVTTRYTGPVAQPTWSPDGRNLAYLSHPGFIGLGNNILTIRSAATGEERFLSPRLRYVNQISWAPDGRSVIAVAITGRGLGIFRIDAETSGITKLTDGGLAPHLCPDGRTLVFVKGETDGPGPIIRKHNLDTGEESEVVIIEGIYFDLSPDGREVVFQVDGAVKTVSLNGGEPRELFRGSAKRYDLRWTRDGRYIIAQATGTASSEIWRVSAQGGTPLKLDFAVPKMNDFTLNPDNRRFAFSVDEGSKSELWVLENFLSAGAGVKTMK